MSRLRVATWNINSLRLRRTLLDKLRDALDPDVICLQETKVPDALFPDALPSELGYPYVVRRGMKGYNGVAIMSRIPLEETPDSPNWCERGDCRHAAATLDLPTGPVLIHNFYVPAGGDIPDPAANPKFAHKLAFVSEVTNWFRARLVERCVLVGDLNIAPLENDVWSHKQLLTVVSHTPIEVEHLNGWLDSNFHDAVRHFVPPDEKLYTWWSYRNQDWRRSNRGRRLDHIWVTRDLVSNLRRQEILIDARDWDRSSDHVPVCVELEV